MGRGRLESRQGVGECQRRASGGGLVAAMPGHALPLSGSQAWPASSTAEQLTLNQQVLGSKPRRVTNQPFAIWKLKGKFIAKSALAWATRRRAVAFERPSLRSGVGERL